MAFEIPCECGRILVVGTGQAGSHLRCTCGKMVDVPSLRNLKAQAVFRPDPVDAHTRSTTDRVVIWTMATLVFSVVMAISVWSIFETGSLAVVGVMIVVISYCWLFLLTIKESGFKGAYFGVYVFAIMRPDVSKWPIFWFFIGSAIALGSIALQH